MTHHHHQVTLLAWISLTLSHFLSLSLIQCLRKVFKTTCLPASWPRLGRSCEEVHGRMSLISSVLFLQQSLACLIHFTCMVLGMFGKRLYSCCVVGMLRPGFVHYDSKHSLDRIHISKSNEVLTLHFSQLQNLSLTTC